MLEGCTWETRTKGVEYSGNSWFGMFLSMKLYSEHCIVGLFGAYVRPIGGHARHAKGLKFGQRGRTYGQHEPTILVSGHNYTQNLDFTFLRFIRKPLREA